MDGCLIHEGGSVTKKLSLYCFAILIFLLGTISTASAHANLLKSSPAENQVVKSSPQQIILAFSEFLEPDSFTLTLYDWEGRPVKIAPPALVKGDASQMSAQLPQLTNGSYTVVWSLVSEDGHPVSGSYIFSVGEKSASVTAPNEKKPASFLDTLLVGLRFIGEALILGVGGYFLVGWLAQTNGIKAVTRFAGENAMFGWVALLFCLIAQAFVYARTLSESNAVVLFQSPFIIMICAQLVLLVALMIPGMAEGWQPFIWLLLIGSLAFGGHSWGIEPVWGSLVVRVIHLISIGVWLGALFFLMRSFAPDKQDKQKIESSSQMRPLFLKVLLVSSIGALLSGVVMVSLQTDWARLLQNTVFWTSLLRSKLILVSIMLLLALFQTIRWRREESLLSTGLLRLEWIIGIAAVLLGVWMSQTAYF